MAQEIIRKFYMVYIVIIFNLFWYNFRPGIKPLLTYPQITFLLRNTNKAYEIYLRILFYIAFNTCGYLVVNSAIEYFSKYI